MPSDKTCSRCGEVKLLSLFKKEKRRASGFAAHCKACHTASQRQLEAQRRIFGPTIVRDHKKCPKCSETKQANAFYRNRGSADWLSSACKVCVDAANMSNYFADPKKAYVRQKAWTEANRAAVNARGRARRRSSAKVREQQREGRRKWRARKRNAEVNDLTEKQWSELLAVNGAHCAYCGSTEHIAQDHAVPLSRGGDHTLVNVVPACRSCNSRKHTMTLLEFVWERAA